MARILGFAALAIVMFAVSACATAPLGYIESPFEHQRVESFDCSKNPKGRNIAVFLDGTANAETSGTNVFRLYNLATLQKPSGHCPVNYTLYVHGVGAGSGARAIVEQATGWGIGKDVRQAYQYLAKTYRGNQDRIYIFGFSRGSAAARILASFLYHAGLPTHIVTDDEEQAEVQVEELYKVYKTVKPSKTKREDLARHIGKDHVRKADVEFMGIFDTVSALGVTHGGEDVADLNAHYSDQLCNVKRVAHAMSADDNRATVFTPALLHKGLFEDCQDKIATFDDFVDQVWFAGAHADVGGGYLDTDLSGVSVNWMIERARTHDLLADDKRHPLFAENAGVYADPLGISHDAAKHFLGGYTNNRNRNLSHYFLADTAAQSAPVLHQSLIDRLRLVPKGCRDFDWIAEPANKKYATNFPKCFDKILVTIDDSLPHHRGSCRVNGQKVGEGLYAGNDSYVLEYKPQADGCPTIWGTDQRQGD